MLSEINQCKKDKHARFHLYKVLSIIKIIDTTRHGSSQGLGGGENGSYCSVGTEFQFCRIKRVLAAEGYAMLYLH